MTAQAVDVCNGVTTRLEYIINSESDDAVGTGDGNTTNDIQGAELGAPDFDFLLRAERAEPGNGRIYTIVYSATDGAGNGAYQEAIVVVPDHRDGTVDPLSVSVSQDNTVSQVTWSNVTGALFYNVVRGVVGNLAEMSDTIELGPLVCLASGVPPADIDSIADAIFPELGTAFFYLVEYNDGLPSSYGSPSASKPSLGEGGCP